MAREGRFCLASSRLPTRCLRRSSTASIYMRSRWRPQTRAYMDAVMALPAWGDWREGAFAEPWTIEKYEIV
ncbi:protein of unknown function [Methylocella tundrae]|uniref:Uncharacterized protein n=1 Tax=Methylocella tundrae TaxID=227605 RepID=A0A4U8YW46_METTU|nr:protein of unknown function [Methylocella tundrae]